MPLFACDAWLLRGRLAVVSGQLAEAKRFRDEAAPLITKHHYGQREPDLAVLDAEISPTLDTFRTASAQVGAEGWWHLMPRLESLVAAQPKDSWFRADPRARDQLLAPLRAAEKRYHEERDAYLRKEAEG
jgi:hypothetical protein